MILLISSKNSPKTKKAIPRAMLKISHRRFIYKVEVKEMKAEKAIKLSRLLTRIQLKIVEWLLLERTIFWKLDSSGKGLKHYSWFLHSSNRWAKRHEKLSKLLPQGYTPMDVTPDFMVETTRELGSGNLANN